MPLVACCKLLSYFSLRVCVYEARWFSVVLKLHSVCVCACVWESGHKRLNAALNTWEEIHAFVSTSSAQHARCMPHRSADKDVAKMPIRSHISREVKNVRYLHHNGLKKMLWEEEKNTACLLSFFFFFLPVSKLIGVSSPPLTKRRQGRAGAAGRPLCFFTRQPDNKDWCLGGMLCRWNARLTCLHSLNAAFMNPERGYQTETGSSLRQRRAAAAAARCTTGFQRLTFPRYRFILTFPVCFPTQSAMGNNRKNRADCNTGCRMKNVGKFSSRWAKTWQLVI